MRNIWLITKREYLERVRTRSFLLLTLLLPAIASVGIWLPTKLVTIGEKPQHIVVVTSRAEFGNMVRQQLLSGGENKNGREANTDAEEKSDRDQYVIDIDTNPTASERELLRQKIMLRAIDSYLWLSDDAIATGKVTWAGRTTMGFGARSRLSEKLSHAFLYTRLSKQGFTASQADSVLKPVKIEAVRIERGREAKDNGASKFLEVFVMVMLLYMTLLFYGISVMRSVLEEKRSRILEVLLSSATSTELMTGKLLGVGVVGLTQILVWAAMATAIALPSLAMQSSMGQLEIPPIVLVAFAVFFLLGYLLYSALYAAIGAISTTEQEGQQLQFLIVIPMVVSIFLLVPAIQTPDAPAIVWMSIIPFFSPLLMYARIVVQPPPLWQIALSLALLIATIAGVLILCARIYRIGVLIYGKRPTLPEILKWMKYAKT